MNVKLREHIDLRLLVWSIKGGVGKTTMSLAISLETGLSIITNEQYTLLDNILPQNQFLILDSEMPVPNVGKASVIFDFAGGIHRDNRVVDAIRQANVILIPTTPDKPDIQGCVSTIAEIEAIDDKKKIIIVINKCPKKDDFDKTVDILRKLVGDCSMLGVKSSKVFQSLYDQKKSVHNIRTSNPLLNIAYKDVDFQITHLIDLIYLKCSEYNLLTDMVNNHPIIDSELNLN